MPRKPFDLLMRVAICRTPWLMSQARTSYAIDKLNPSAKLRIDRTVLPIQEPYLMAQRYGPTLSIDVRSAWSSRKETSPWVGRDAGQFSRPIDSLVT